MGKREFTRATLSRYTGKDGVPAFVACDGIVYDVSRSFLWQDGKHQVVHTAAADLTCGLERAPHGADVLKRFPVMGILVEGAEARGELEERSSVIMG